MSDETDPVAPGAMDGIDAGPVDGSTETLPGDAQDAPAAASSEGAPADAGTASPPKKRFRLWKILVAAAVVVVLAIGGACAWSFLAFTKDEDTVAAADEHWSAAMESMDTIATCREGLESSTGTSTVEDLPEWIASLEEMGPKAAKELDESESLARKLKDEEMRTGYLEAVRQAKGALAEAGTAVPLMKDALVLYKAGPAVRDLTDKGDDLQSDAVGSCNADNHKVAVGQAQQAVAAYDEAKRRLDEMAAVAPKSDGGAASDDIQLGYAMLAVFRELAAENVASAEAGKAGRISQHNAAVDRYNVARRKLRDVKEPGFFGDMSVFGADAVTQLQSAEDTLYNAKIEHDNAL
jgi:hypothetical protein